VTDAVGKEIIVPHDVKRVATLAPGVTEIVVAAGGLDRLVGVSNADDFPPSVRELPRYSALPVNHEAVVALEPDVVLGAAQVNDNREVAVFGDLGIPAYFVRSESLSDVLDSILTVGRILGTETAASATVDSLRLRVAALESRSAGLERPRVLFLISTTTLHSFGPESYVHDLIQLAGGESITAELDVENPVLDDEFVLARNPEVILGTFRDGFVNEDLLASHPTWAAVSAVRNRRVHVIDGDLVLRNGPRLVDGAEEMFRVLHGDVADGSKN